MGKKIGLIAGPLAFILIQLFLSLDDLNPSARAVLAVTAWTAIWWITEAIPIAVASLLPMVLFPLTGVLEAGATTEAYGHNIVFLFLGGFILAMAFERWNLHRRVALMTILLIGNNQRMIILGAMLATALLSMWISNTATSVMMLPIAIAIAKQMQDDPATELDENSQFGKALMLSIAYSASIGGMASLIGTPVNLVFAGQLKTVFGVEVGFLEWMSIGLPTAVIMLAICWFYLTKIAFKFDSGTLKGGREEIQRMLDDQGKISREEKLVLGVFTLTAFCWIFRKALLTQLLPGIDDTVIAIAAAIILFLIPGGEKGNGLLTWQEAVRLPWGVVLLMGGGFALAAGFDASGLADFLASTLSVPDSIGLFVVVLLVVAAINFLTEVTSNVATVSMLMPVLAAAALPLNIHPYLLMVPATLAATCAFMLPVATPPNAVVFGSGYLTIPDMVRAGFRLNVISIVVITTICYLILPLLWGFKVEVLPDWVK